jgi:hypothetical protein
LKHILLTLSILLIVAGCSNDSYDSGISNVDGKKLKKLVEDALWGSVTANSMLSALINPETPSPDYLNQLAIDSTVNTSGLKLFSVLIEYPNPKHNILAVYDENLNLLLEDNSLNGNIAVKWENLSGKLYLAASENFLCKDILKLSRLSLYSTVSKKVDLVFRAFTRLEKAGKIYQQYIKNTSSVAIVTRIISNTRFKLNDATDTFRFNSFTNEYSSSDNSFNQFVMLEINSANWPLENPELKIDTAEIEQVIEDANTNNDTETFTDIDGYQVSLNSDWNDPIRISVINYLISKLEGIRYINEKLGAQITVIELPDGSSSSQFVKYKFKYTSQDKYHVRSTDLLKSGKNLFQFFEHSCSNKTYLLLIQAPKYTYEKNKIFYDEVTNSFFIEC